jgi:hypothetical protein
MGCFFCALLGLGLMLLLSYVILSRLYLYIFRVGYTMHMNGDLRECVYASVFVGLRDHTRHGGILVWFVIARFPRLCPTWTIEIRGLAFFCGKSSDSYIYLAMGNRSVSYAS